MGVTASEKGKKAIRQALEDKSWGLEDKRFRQAVSRILEDEDKERDKVRAGDTKRQYAFGASDTTLKRFVHGTLPISSRVFKACCQALELSWLEIAEPAPQNSNDQELVPLGDEFYGREKELQEIKQWLSKDCRLVILYGIGGVGKTALAAKLWEELRNDFSKVIWRPLVYTYPLEAQLIDLLRCLSSNNVEQSNNEGMLMSHLIAELRRQRVLIFLDEFVPSVAGDQRDRSYLNLFERFATTNQLKSSIVLTIRQKPADITSIGDPIVQAKALTGIDCKSTYKILKTRGLNVEQTHCEKLVERYSSNPLALKIVASWIHKRYRGNVSRFLENPVTITPKISAILEQQIRDLNPEEQEVLKELARSDEPKSQNELKGSSFSMSISKLDTALYGLERRALLEKFTTDGQVLYTLPPMVKQFIKDCTNHLMST